MRRSCSWSRSRRLRASSTICASLRGWWTGGGLAQMLVKTYLEQIAAETKVSTATIVRVARFLNSGNDGYRTIMRRQGKIDG